MMLQKKPRAELAHAANILPLADWAARVNFAEHEGSKVVSDKHRKAYPVPIVIDAVRLPLCLA